MLAPLLVDHAVLQRERPIVIFGTAAAAERVTLTLGSERATTRADANGRWQVTLSSRAASTRAIDLIVTGADGNPVEARDLLIGDVWLCSGQSNMEMQVGAALNAYNEVEAANDPLLRLVTIPRASTDTAARTTAAPLQWQPVAKETLGAFSAACYYMARALRAKLKVPVGAVAASWGGTKIAPWLVGGPLYNGMIAPLGGFGIKGVAWYQGESDVGSTGYRDRLALLMKGWRAQFRQADLPFLVVGLANFGAYAAKPVGSSWADLREEQRQAVLADRHAAIVPAFDIGERTDVHPANKQAVGQRLAAAAGAIAYGDTQSALPTVRTAHGSADGSIVVSFDHVSGALHSWSGDQALAFELCNKDRTDCRFARARTAGATVILQGDGQSADIVRYGWADSPVINLYDDRALPPGAFQIAVEARP